MTNTTDPQASPFWPADNPAALGHITLLQGTIARLATASTHCKTWCLALVSALLGLAGATQTLGIITFAVVSVVVLGLMDATYLAQERAYRELYSRTVDLMRTRKYELLNVFDASAPLSVGRILAALSSWSIWPIYGGLVAAYVVAKYAGWLAASAAATSN